MQRRTLIIFAWIALYAAVTAYSAITYQKHMFDYAAIVGVLGLLFLIMRPLGIPDASFIFWGLAVLPHALGTIPFGDDLSLYHPAYFFGNYDLFSHFLGFCFFTIGCLLVLARMPQAWKVHVLALVFIALAGVGTMIEMTEFAGYLFFGFGWGAFQFGAGDNSHNFGPWGDSMSDLFANLAGISLAFLACIYLRSRELYIRPLYAR